MMQTAQYGSVQYTGRFYLILVHWQEEVACRPHIIYSLCSFQWVETSSDGFLSLSSLYDTQFYPTHNPLPNQVQTSPIKHMGVKKLLT